MQEQIIRLSDWWSTPAGQYLLAWEQAQLDGWVADLFGYNAVQLGWPALDALQANRMPHRWLALPAIGADFNDGVSVVCDPAALPLASSSLDLLVLPHALEGSADPHQVLREAERVLVPDGRLILSAFNPNSWWGLQHSRARWCHRLGFRAWGADQAHVPETGEFIGAWRLRDWLRLMGLEIEHERRGCYVPAVNSERWLRRHAWMDRMGPRWWPFFGAVHMIVAVKRVRGMRLLGPAWKPRQSTAGVPASVAQRR
jgi:SAM-dependent methyltransferase